MNLQRGPALSDRLTGKVEGLVRDNRVERHALREHRQRGAAVPASAGDQRFRIAPTGAECFDFTADRAEPEPQFLPRTYPEFAPNYPENGYYRV
jgi:hypothetical protein